MDRMSESNGKRIPILLWPFYAIWRLLTFVLTVVGRLLCSLLGIALMIAGVVVAMSVIGAPLGIPLAALGFLLVIRALF
jgi:membrane protein YqaA with SNARE-associated domain